MASHSSSTSPNCQLRQRLIPRSKFDTDAVLYLNKLDPKEWEPVAYDILDSCADCNWPISTPIFKLFLKYPQNAITPIRKLFRESDDYDWQWNVLSYIVNGMPNEWQVKLLDDLIYLRTHSSEQSQVDYEWYEDMDRIISELKDYKGSLERGTSLPVI